MDSSVLGYYQYPTLFEDRVVFVSEDVLWCVCAEGGVATKLTADRGALYHPAFSPDGKWIAFTGTQEGHGEVYVMPSRGGPSRRLTFFDQKTDVLGWTPQGDIVFKSDHGMPFARTFEIYSISREGGSPVKLPAGIANDITWGPEGLCVIQRHGYGYTQWKRYRGGAAGELWIDPDGTGQFRQLLNLPSNNLRPIWIRGRIYFLSDHNGHGNLYSCTSEGQDIQRHTDASGFYVRQIKGGAAPGDTRIVYKEGADLKIFDAQTGKNRAIAITYPTSCPYRARTFVDPFSNLTNYALSPNGQDLMLTTRGRLFQMNPFRGPVFQNGTRHGVRYRLGQWLSDTQTIAVKDQGREEILEIFGEDPLKAPQQIMSPLWGRILTLHPSPKGDAVLMTNHRHELWHLTIKNKKMTKLDHSAFGSFDGVDWSPDGQYAAYSIPTCHSCRIIRLVHIKTQEKTDLTEPLTQDFCPRFDPLGRFLYFLSFRTLHSHRDPLKFDWTFQMGVRPYLITLKNTLTSPFILPTHSGEAPQKEKVLKIDLPGIQDRILPFPVLAGDYGHLVCSSDKIFWLTDNENLKESGESAPQGQELQMYDLETLKMESLASDVHTLILSANGEQLAYTNSEKKIRVLKAGEKSEEPDLSYKLGGWVDSTRICLEKDPFSEWRFMFEEAWRLQKDLFWHPEMRQVDWEVVRERYLPLVERVGTVSELMDVIQEMQGELGVSHAYTWGYEQNIGSDYTLGQLGATFAFDRKAKAWCIETISRGDLWDPEKGSPLLKPGLHLQPGTRLWAIDGVPLSETRTPAQALVHKAKNLVAFLVSDPKQKTKRTVWVRPLEKSTPLRYRDWVEKNRRYVREKTKGQVGYIHIPDMTEEGFSEFFRMYRQEFQCKGLILDVRFNGGGEISSVLLSILSRKRLGFDQTRWEGQIPYLMESPTGPMVALCNEFTGSDGDMFAYSFQRLHLGSLVGKRTWGGVIGIFPRHPLLDGSVTSQPEYAIWFHDVGWSLENKGAEPDIIIENTPQDDHLNLDRQLDKGIEVVLQEIKDL